MKNPNPNPNPSIGVTNMNNKKKNGKTSEEQFEFCQACRLNHNQGRKHIYFPNHKKALSAFLSRFQLKLSDVKFFLKNPSPLRPEHASHSHLWCVFCDHDLLELESHYACENAIAHFASADHLKKVKAFLWKHGGGMDRVDAFCISSGDFAKWQKKCQSFKNEAAREGSHGQLIGPMNNIHYKLNSDYVNSNGMSKIHSVNCEISNDVLPLQNYTDERSQVSRPRIFSATGAGSELHDMRLGTEILAPRNSAGYIENQHSLNSLAQNCPPNDYLINAHVFPDERVHSAESTSQGLLNPTRISSSVGENTEGNVHSGAPPPWFNGNEDNLLDKLKSEQHRLVSPLSERGKSSKLNPKRVGAAWAERRKIELELERKGEVNAKTYDANWLPNFGRVWQSGSRKESRKEFQIEKRASVKDESQSEKPLVLQPYISKRMLSDLEESFLWQRTSVQISVNDCSEMTNETFITIRIAAIAALFHAYASVSSFSGKSSSKWNPQQHLHIAMAAPQDEKLLTRDFIAILCEFSLLFFNILDFGEVGSYQKGLDDQDPRNSLEHQFCEVELPK